MIAAMTKGILEPMQIGPGGRRWLHMVHLLLLPEVMSALHPTNHPLRLPRRPRLYRQHQDYHVLFPLLCLG